MQILWRRAVQFLNLKNKKQKLHQNTNQTTLSAFPTIIFFAIKNKTKQNKLVSSLYPMMCVCVCDSYAEEDQREGDDA